MMPESSKVTQVRGGVAEEARQNNLTLLSI